MKIYQINIFGNLSTGKIAVDLARVIKNEGHECRVAYARNTIASDIDSYIIGNKWDVRFHALMTRITDRTGFYSKNTTRKLIQDIETYKPDVVHLHNVHGYYVNIELLFNYLKKTQIPVVWTLHDCWAFTGHCAYFDYVGCEKWKTGCHKCEQKHTYPSSKIIDNSKKNWLIKKELFSGLNMTIVTPSDWLNNLVKESFLKEYSVVTIYNGIDLEVFKPTQTDFRAKNGLEGKLIILGVAGEWSERKGLKDFIKLSKMLDENQKVVLVGLNDKQLKEIPDSIIGIKRTDSAEELAGLYTTADVFFNPTYEDNYPTVNLEAIACGTFVVTYDTGGSGESIRKEKGYIVTLSNIYWYKDVYNQIKIQSEAVCDNHYISKENMLEKYTEVFLANIYEGSGVW